MNGPYRPPPPDDPYRDFRLLVERMEKAVNRHWRMTTINLIIFGFIIGRGIAEAINWWFEN